MFEKLTLNQRELLRISLEKFIVRGTQNRADKIILIEQLNKEIEEHDDANTKTL